MERIRRLLTGVGLAAAVLWAVAFGLVGLVAVFIVWPVGLVALTIAPLPLVWALVLWATGEAAATTASAGAGAAAWGQPPGTHVPAYAWPMTDPGQVTRQSLERGLLTALDLVAPMAGPGGGGPWMPVDVTTSSPPAVRPLEPDGQPVPMLAEAGTVLAGPGPQQAVRHMIAAYPPAIADSALNSEGSNQLGVFGGEVAAMSRVPDAYPVGEVRTALRIVAATGVVSRVVVWRRGPLIAHLAVSGDEMLAQILLGHATQVADTRLLHLFDAWAGGS